MSIPLDLKKSRIENIRNPMIFRFGFMIFSNPILRIEGEIYWGGVGKGRGLGDCSRASLVVRSPTPCFDVGFFTCFNFSTTLSLIVFWASSCCEMVLAASSLESPSSLAGLGRSAFDHSAGVRAQSQSSVYAVG